MCIHLKQRTPKNQSFVERVAKILKLEVEKCAILQLGSILVDNKGDCCLVLTLDSPLTSFVLANLS
jgi:hypothetical protein